MTTTIEEFQKNPGPFLEKVQGGTELLLMSGNIPSVKLTAVSQTAESQSALPEIKKPRTIRRPAGWAKGKITITGDIDGPILTKEDWGRLWPGE